MTENEYILVSELTKIRAATELIRRIMPQAVNISQGEQIKNEIMSNLGILEDAYAGLAGMRIRD